MNSRAALSFNRHPELVSGSIWPHGLERIGAGDLTERAVASCGSEGVFECTLELQSAKVKNTDGDKLRWPAC